MRGTRAPGLSDMNTDDEYKLLLQHPELMRGAIEALAETLEREVTVGGLNEEIRKVVAAIHDDYRVWRMVGRDTADLRDYYIAKPQDHLMLLATAIGRERGKRWARK